MRPFTYLIALAIAIGAVVVPTAARAQPAETAVVAPVTSVVFAPTNYGVLAPGQPLVISGSITNTTSAALPVGSATVYLNRAVVSRRSDLSTWLHPASLTAADKLGTQVFETPTPAVDPGHTVQIQLTVPAADINFGYLTSTWGTRTLAVRVTAGGVQVGQVRSSVVWNTGSVEKTGLALAIPLTVPESSDGLIPSDLLAAYTAPGGFLYRELNHVINQNIAIAIDPRIIASIEILGSSTPPTALAWLDRLRAATNPTFALSYADYDLAAASQAKAQRILTPTSFPINPKLFPPVPSISPTMTPSTVPTPTVTPTPTPGVTVAPLPDTASLLTWNYTLNSLAWPADGSIIASDLATFQTAGLTTTILSSSNVGYGSPGYTPNASSQAEGHQVIVSDRTLSTLLRAAATAQTDADWSTAMTHLASTLAIISRERPSLARTVLATLDRSMPDGGDRFPQTLAALAALPWVGLTPFTQLTSAFAAGQPALSSSTTIVAQPEPARRIAQVGALLAADASSTSFSSILVDPTVITGERRLSLLAMLSTNWATDDGWQEASDKYLARTSKILKSVSIAKSSSVHIIATNSALPVTVMNELAWPVTVYVTVRSPSNILSVTNERVELTVEAESQAKVNVPVTSNANGQSLVGVRLSSSTNVPISGLERIQVDVQAGWETVFTSIIAALLVALFGFGIYRTIARRRKSRRGQTERTETEPEQSKPSQNEPSQSEPDQTADAAALPTSPPGSS